MSGPKRAILGDFYFPANAEGNTNQDEIRELYLRWAHCVKLPKDTLDIIRKMGGGELKYILNKIKNNQYAAQLMFEIRQKGVLASIHSQQVLGAALAKDPLFQYDETLEVDYAGYLLNRAVEFLGMIQPDLYFKIEPYLNQIKIGIQEEICNTQTFPYKLQFPRLTHSFNPDQNWSAGYANIKGANDMDGFHNQPPGLLLKALGLVYGMKKITVQENFFTEEIKTDELYQDGLLSMYSKADKNQAFVFLGRVVALLAMASLPSHLDNINPNSEDIYKNQFIPILLEGISEVISKPDTLFLETQFFNSGWLNSHYKNEVLNYLENEFPFAGNLTAIFMKVGQRADFYPTMNKIGNEIADFTNFPPYYPNAYPYSSWNYYPVNSLVLIAGNLGHNEDYIVVKTKNGKIFTVQKSLVEIAMHLQPLTIAGIIKLIKLIIK